MICTKIMRAFWRLVNLIVFINNKVKFNMEISFNGYVILKKDKTPDYNGTGGEIRFGKKIGINSGRKFNLIGGDSKLILRVINDGRIIIGNNVGMSNVTLVARNLIKIDDDVLLGGGVKIYDNDFHSLDFDTRINHPYEDIKSKPVIVKHGAFIGAHSIVLKGVTIGERSIVGAGSVVTKNIPNDEIWGGNPAKFIRKIDNISVI